MKSPSPSMAFKYLLIFCFLCLTGCKDLFQDQQGNSKSSDLAASSDNSKSESKNPTMAEIKRGLKTAVPVTSALTVQEAGKITDKKRLKALRRRSVMRELNQRLNQRPPKKSGNAMETASVQRRRRSVTKEQQAVLKQEFDGKRQKKNARAPEELFGLKRTEVMPNGYVTSKYFDPNSVYFSSWDYVDYISDDCSSENSWCVTYYAPAGTLEISAEFAYVDMESGYDQVKLYDAYGLCASYTGNLDFFESATCSGDWVEIRVRTDGSRSGDLYDGFLINGFYYTVEEYNYPPTAIAFADPTSVYEGDSVYFDATESYDDDGYYSDLRFEWNFGDGDYSYSDIAYHTYSHDGIYTVSLRVTDANGEYSYDYVTVYVYDNTPPEAILTLDPADGKIDQLTALQATGSGSPRAVWQSIDWGDWTSPSSSSNMSTWFSHYYDEPGTYFVVLQVQNAGGLTDTALKVAEVSKPIYPPTISGFNPPSGQEGDTITIKGTHLGSVTKVKFNGLEADFYFDSEDDLDATRLYAVVPVGATSGPIKVVNPKGSATSSSSFTVAPIITALSPSSGPVGTVVDIQGRNLEPITLVKLGTLAVTPLSISASSIKIRVPDVNDVASGFVTVSSSLFTAQSPTIFGITPTVSDFNPKSGTPIPETPIVITGKTFNGATQVRIGSQAISFQVDSDTQITARTTAALEYSGPITVVNAYGSGVSAGSFTVVLPLPVIGSLSPLKGNEESKVTIYGSNFRGITSVTFGERAATFNRVSESQIDAYVPVNATDGFVTVTNSAGTATSREVFTVTYAAPLITGLSPLSAVRGAPVVITGLNLRHTTGVFFNEIPATTFTEDSPNQITAQIPATVAVGEVIVKVTTFGGNAASPQALTVLPFAPVISSIEPLKGPRGSEVVLKGENFEMVQTIKFKGGVEALDFKVISPTELWVTVPPKAKRGSANKGKIKLITSGGQAKSGQKFKVTKQ